MLAKWMLALLAACSIGGCCNPRPYRPCGPGFLNNAFVPQSFAGADFRAACQRHDDCYATGVCSRKACDDDFLNEVLASCECSKHPHWCRHWSWHWYLRVRLVGRLGYHPRRTCCGQLRCHRQICRQKQCSNSVSDGDREPCCRKCAGD